MAASAAVLEPTLPASRAIPSSFKESFVSWWTVGQKQGAASEERLLRKLPFYIPKSSSRESFDGPVIAHSEQVELQAPRHYINTLSIESTSPSSNPPPPAVLLHGYGAGLGFYFRNFVSLANWAANHGTNVYALDWLGMGRSARVPFTVKAPKHDIPGRVSQAESFFVDSLEEWRQKMGLEKMTLIGHSLGAYFSVVYALKYPTRVNKLILLSPAGVPRNTDTSLPERELTDEADTNPGGDVEGATHAKIEAMRQEQRAQKRKEPVATRVFKYLWEEGWSPFQVLRSTLFWGPMLVGKYSSRRFSGLTEEETRDMHDYILNISLAKGSGEYCISHILAPGAYARLPLVDRIHSLKIPVTFVYGDHDWMDPSGGEESVEKLRQAGNGQCRQYIIGNAGHHVYLDNPKAVNDLLIKELDRRHRPIH